MEKYKLITTDAKVPDEKKIIEITKPQPDSVSNITIETIKNRIVGRNTNIALLQVANQKDSTLITAIQSSLNLI